MTESDQGVDKSDTKRIDYKSVYVVLTLIINDLQKHEK